MPITTRQELPATDRMTVIRGRPAHLIVARNAQRLEPGAHQSLPLMEPLNPFLTIAKTFQRKIRCGMILVFLAVPPTIRQTGRAAHRGERQIR
jgi:hypothetical protein